MPRPAGRGFQAVERRRMRAAAAKRRAASGRRCGDTWPEIAHDSMHRGLAILGDADTAARPSRKSGRGAFRTPSYPQLLLKSHMPGKRRLNRGA